MKYMKRVFAMDERELRAALSLLMPEKEEELAGREEADRSKLQEELVQWLLSEGLSARHEFVFYREDSPPNAKDKKEEANEGDQQQQQQVWLLSRRTRGCPCCEQQNANEGTGGGWRQYMQSDPSSASLPKPPSSADHRRSPPPSSRLGQVPSARPSGIPSSSPSTSRPSPSTSSTVVIFHQMPPAQNAKNCNTNSRGGQKDTKQQQRQIRTKFTTDTARVITAQPMLRKDQQAKLDKEEGQKKAEMTSWHWGKYFLLL